MLSKLGDYGRTDCTVHCYADSWNSAGLVNIVSVFLGMRFNLLGGVHEVINGINILGYLNIGKL